MPNRKTIPAPQYDQKTRERLKKNSTQVPFSGCWLWTGATVPSGYGKLVYLGRIVGAHRVSYMLNVGPIPDGLLVCHHCDVPACINPDHLFLGTHQDNIDDMMQKGRGAKPDHNGSNNPMFGRQHRDQAKKKQAEKKAGLYVGSHHPKATITEDVAALIKRAKGSGTAKAVAEALGVSFHVVRNIWSGKSWGHIHG